MLRKKTMLAIASEEDTALRPLLPLVVQATAPEGDRRGDCSGKRQARWLLAKRDKHCPGVEERLLQKETGAETALAKRQSRLRGQPVRRSAGADIAARCADRVERNRSSYQCELATEMRS